ncbi:Hypothetical predicted protein [Olea europaea subsp. europaea]|uniref:Uncharacterized protein n=1 Tax=Olea europaea subsp. europaea TaxID=158383 RepID=A0A8S0S914_OLEEU|nr:Hypothetical predicted protein [Olea europaea subsp. europaea]
MQCSLTHSFRSGCLKIGRSSWLVTYVTLGSSRTLFARQEDQNMGTKVETGCLQPALAQHDCCSFARLEDQDVGTERNIAECAVSLRCGSKGIAVTARNYDHHRTTNFVDTIRPPTTQASCSCS